MHFILFTAQMNSKETETRDEACVAIGNLAVQCSDAEVIEKLVRHLFGVLNGRSDVSSILEII